MNHRSRGRPTATVGVVATFVLLALLATFARLNFPGTLGGTEYATADEDQFLNNPRVPQLSLFPARQTNATIAPDACPTDAVSVNPYPDTHGDDRVASGSRRCADGTLEIFVNQPDGYHRAWTKVFYPQQPGEQGQRLELSVIYAPNTDELMHSERYWLTGKLKQLVDVANKLRHTTEFAADGITPLEEQVVDQSPCCHQEFPLKLDRRWSVTPDHALVYSNIMSDDGSNTETFLDPHGSVSKVFRWKHYPLVSLGVTGVGYYPGANNRLFESSADNYYDTVIYYNSDQTRKYQIRIASNDLYVDYFGKSGTNVALTQQWKRHVETTKDGGRRVTYSLEGVTTFDETGLALLTIYLSDEKIDFMEVVNAVGNDGVNYRLIAYYYSKGMFTEAYCWPGPVGEGKPVHDTVVPKIDPRGLLTASMSKPPPPVDDDLPVPEVQRGF
jgi:hypothetical protein